jgi:hypothetical protein
MWHNGAHETWHRLRIRVRGSGFGVRGPGVKLGGGGMFGVHGCGVRDSGFKFRVSGFGFRVGGPPTRRGTPALALHLLIVLN